VDIFKSLLIAVGAFVPALLVGIAVTLHASGAPVDPFTPDEQRIIEAIAKSKWAQELASAMATTPEAREQIARMLAIQMYRTVRRVSD
jgi:F0F1-type ATP synthase membrane subunit c/vacuolar-type H+-ATPase subunit K